jgi:molybdenum cofactor cytidylyltransferase
MPPQAAQFCLGVAVLAAGAAARMGRPKLLLPWGTTSVLGHLVEQWRTLQAEQVTVVCAQDEPAIQAELDRLRFPRPDRLFNAHPERGMFSSIQCAAQWSGWKPALTHWTIVLGDQPHIRERTLRQLLAFAAAHPDKICQPARSGHRRHPLVLPVSPP